MWPHPVNISCFFRNLRCWTPIGGLLWVMDWKNQSFVASASVVVTWMSSMLSLRWPRFARAWGNQIVWTTWKLEPRSGFGVHSPWFPCFCLYFDLILIREDESPNISKSWFVLTSWTASGFKIRLIILPLFNSEVVPTFGVRNCRTRTLTRKKKSNSTHTHIKIFPHGCSCFTFPVSFTWMVSF